MAKLQSQQFTVDGTFIVPIGVSLIWLTLIGSGASGGNHQASNINGAGGGGAAEFCSRLPVKVTSGASIAITIGGGGGASLFGNSVFCEGGYPGTALQSGPSVPPWACSGGGVGGGKLGSASGFPPNGLPAIPGRGESRSFWGGSSGGGTPSGNFSPALLGGRSCPWEGGAGGSMASEGNPGGSGGGSSPFGQGGQGGDSKNFFEAPDATVNGHAPSGSISSGFYGAGGGGVGGVNSGSAFSGGTGADGYCLVQWVA